MTLLKGRSLLLSHFDWVFMMLEISISEKAEKFPFGLWRFLKWSFFSAVTHDWTLGRNDTVLIFLKKVPSSLQYQEKCMIWFRVVLSSENLKFQWNNWASRSNASLAAHISARRMPLWRVTDEPFEIAETCWPIYRVHLIDETHSRDPEYTPSK
jgi:hypothetical protein